MSVAINAEHVSKEYRLGIINHGVLFRDIQSWWARKTGKPDPHSKIGAEHFADQKDRFWALKDVSFEIEQGDRVGIIGRNGAGKSTLLKILSRITEPTEGRIKIKGRVASLLEVGTGFHPELTGRDNIYLSGAIQGMKKREIDRKIDEIIAFSEIEKFIDTPVKRYSSGMYVRLAFAVAAHLDSEILLADEVLAVGDQEFQKKCLGKMEDVSKNEGRTVLFVSHNMTTIGQLCRNAVMLVSGEVSLTGPISEVIGKYTGNGGETDYYCDHPIEDAGFGKIWFENSDGKQVHEIVNDETYCMCFEIESHVEDGLELKVLASDELMRPLWAFTNSMYGLKPLYIDGKKVIKLFIENQSITTQSTSFEASIRSFSTRKEIDVVNSMRVPVVFMGQYASITRYHEWPILCRASMSK